jgi:hypothetical protein
VWLSMATTEKNGIGGGGGVADHAWTAAGVGGGGEERQKPCLLLTIHVGFLVLGYATRHVTQIIIGRIGGVND